MTQGEFNTSLLSLKIEYLDCYSLYTGSRALGDYISAKHQVELIKALYVHLKVLDYCYENWDVLEDIDIEMTDVMGTMEAAISCIRTFKPFYYD